jgi:hypothetical protein
LGLILKKKSLSAAFLTAIIISVILVSTVHFGTAQSGTPTSTPTATVASRGNGNLELTMTLDKTVYSLGEPVNLTLAITNISSQTINFTHRIGF